ncbi:hypothetical protein IEQ34_011394 [Dendrobium chrysotoxum]|uniref:Uncharacterized protein n=1 Tax=Dendrobium chrysotoxum TaxID=161865 RepID=A0AAV7GA41_DENCH|nr:hypothetical protein IEQ34_011394 [Dendrobium chrysotoxum]
MCGNKKHPSSSYDKSGFISIEAEQRYGMIVRLSKPKWAGYANDSKRGLGIVMLGSLCSSG